MLADLPFRIFYRVAWRLLRLWWRVRGGGGRGAAVAIWQGERLLVVQPSYRRGLSLPGGGLRWREPPVSGALRELQEETGLELAVEDVRPGPRLQFREGARRITEWVFEGEIAKRPMLLPDRREIVAIHWMTVEELDAARCAPGLAAYLACRCRKRGVRV